MKSKKVELINNIIQHDKKFEELKKTTLLLYNLDISKSLLRRWVDEYCGIKGAINVY